MRRRWVAVWMTVGVVVVGCRGASKRESPAPDPAVAKVVAPPAPPSVAPAPLTCPEGMVLIPAGSFMTGVDEPLAGLAPHTVSVESFCLDRTEVTTGAYRACTTCTPSADVEWEVGNDMDRVKRRDCNQARGGRDEHPINCVTWFQADAYCKAVGKRLPTSDEWELAASGGPEGRKYPTGNKRPDSTSFCWEREWEGWTSRSAEERGDLDMRYGTCPVKSYPAQAYGLFDMAGNVGEWTSTPLRLPAWLANRPHVQDSYVIEGCDWTEWNEKECRAIATRGAGAPRTEKNATLGFRCAKS